MDGSGLGAASVRKLVVAPPVVQVVPPFALSSGHTLYVVFEARPPRFTVSAELMKSAVAVPSTKPPEPPVQDDVLIRTRAELKVPFETKTTRADEWPMPSTETEVTTGWANAQEARRKTRASFIRKLSAISRQPSAKTRATRADS